jgi:hypothetical protein
MNAKMSAGLLVAAAVALTLASREKGEISTQTEVHASGAAYQAETHDGTDGTFYINIDILDSAHLSSGAEDYSAYKTENDARIDGWVANPGSAPTIVGKDVMVTFKHPLSGVATQNLVNSANLQVDTYNEVAAHSKSGRSFSISVGPVDVPYVDGLIASGPISSPPCDGAPSDESCYTTTTTGIISVTGKITANGLASLNTLRNHPDVYLADSTGIDYLVSNPPSVANYAVVLPAAMWSNSAQISWP